MRIERTRGEYEIVNEGRTKTVSFQFPEDGFIVDNNFFHHVQLLIQKLHRRSGELVVVVPQDMRTATAIVKQKDARTFTLEGDVIRTVELDGVAIEVSVDPGDGRLLRLTTPFSKVVVER
jgi:hypothetical protein